MMLSAATVTDDITRDVLIGQVHTYAASSINSKVFSAYYDPTTGIVDDVVLYSGSGVNS